jgi:hypothetical protein
MSCDIETGWLLSSFIFGGLFGAAIGLLTASVFVRRGPDWRLTTDFDERGRPATRPSLQPTLRSLQHQSSDPENWHLYSKSEQPSPPLPPKPRVEARIASTNSDGFAKVLWFAASRRRRACHTRPNYHSLCPKYHGPNRSRHVHRLFSVAPRTCPGRDSAVRVR